MSKIEWNKSILAKTSNTEIHFMISRTSPGAGI